MISKNRIIEPILPLIAALCCLASFSCSPQPPHPAPPVHGNEVVFDIASLPLEEPQFYTLRHREKDISFFVVRLNTGVFSFFDACSSCYTKKRGYRSEPGRVVCRSCGTSYPVSSKLKGIGGCYPLQLEGRTQDGTYRIPLTTLFAGADKF